MLDESGLVRVLDLGLARLVEASNPFGETAPGPLTQSGTYMGTVDFMAPEQGVDSRRVDHRADIYSLGCTLCYLLTGRAPFEGAANILARLMAHQEQAAASLRAARPDVPQALDAVYLKMMAKKPDDRPASMSAVVASLEACRTSTGDAEKARSGLKSFAASVIMKRALPKGTVPDSSVFNRDNPAELSIGPDLKLEDVLFEAQKPDGPIAPTVTKPGASPRKRFAPGRPRNRTGRKSPALALGAVALLAVGGLGYALLPRRAGTATNPIKDSVPQRSADGTKGSPSSSPRPETPWDAAAFRVGSIWANPAKKLKLEVVERDAKSFKARFTTGASLCEVSGSIEGNRFEWRAAAVRPIRGGPGFDNKGTIRGNTIDLSWPGGSSILAAEGPANEEARLNSASEDWVDLFNGKDKSGWVDQQSLWMVENGLLIGTGGTGYLDTTRPDFANFHIRVEAMINDLGNSGIQFRAGPVNYYEAQIEANGKDQSKTGSLYAVMGGHTWPLVSLNQSPAPANQWFTMDVVADGYHITISVNGKKVTETWDNDRVASAGPVRLEVHTPQTLVKFRKVQIHETP